MHHRYGRHGPHAWRQRRKHRFEKPSTALVSVVRVAIVYIQLPVVDAERIILVLNTSNFPEDYNSGNPIDIDATRHTDITPQNADDIPRLSPGDMALADGARWQAFSDANEIKDLSESGKFVRVDWPRLDSRIKRVVSAYLEKVRLNGGKAPERTESQRLMEVCRTAYRARFNEEMSGDQDSISYLIDPVDARLRMSAISDRSKYPSRSYRDFHIRDIAVVRVIHELGISFDAAIDRLSEIHSYADKYQGYYFNTREEVIWPSDQEIFLSR